MNRLMQKWWQLILIPGIACLLFGLWPTGQQALLAASDHAPAGIQLVVKSSTPQAMVVELTVNDYTVETLTHDSDVFQRVNISGTEQTSTPGTPQIPSRGTLLGLPTTSGVAVQILDADYETKAGYKLYPAPQLTTGVSELNSFTEGEVHETFTLDPARYATDTFYPASPVALGEVGYLRDQAVAQARFYPVLYNPVRGELRIYHRLLIQVTWDATAQAATTNKRGSSPAYEGLLQRTLLNYDQLKRPTVGDVVTSKVVTVPVQAATPNAPPALKIGVNTDGLYRITYTDLVNAGFNVAGIDPHTLKLTNQSAEVALFVQGEEDGVFDSTDVILFYGKAIHDVYTTLNVYWLSAGGDAGRRMARRNGALSGNAAVPDHFPTTLHAEEDTAYWQTMPGYGEDRWFWGKRLSPNTKDMPSSRPYSVIVHNIAANTTATVHVQLKGYTGLGHRTRITLNGHLIDEQAWYGQTQFTHNVSVPSAFLLDGENVVLVNTVDTGAVVDQLLVNWIEIDSLATYRADNNQLRFSAPATGVYQFAIGGFTKPDVSLFDITDPTAPALLTNAVVGPDGRRYSVKFEDNAPATNRYLALTAAQIQVPASLTLDQPSTWKSPANGADYIIITHENFYGAALVLADHRRATGLRVATVKVDDIYDEFNGGVFNPKAIRDFLTYAYQNWQTPAPTYVVLLGDANQDYKDNLQTGTPNYVPSQNVESDLFGEVSSDDWFVTVSGDDRLPDMLIGRLVAQTSQEASDIVAKIIHYEQSPPDVTWNKNVLLVADDDETKFKDISEDLATHLPYYYAVNRIYMERYPPGNPTTDIINQINHGNLLVNYAGHGEYFGWGQWNQNQQSIFEIADVNHLNNSERLPVITIANCLNGFFAGPKANTSLAEALQRRPQGGAVAIWAPTSLEYPTGHGVLLNAFYSALFGDDQHALGVATTAAKVSTLTQSSFWSELAETYVLFGDPATQLGMPTNFPYLQSTTPRDGATNVSLDQPLQVVFRKPMNPSTVTLGIVPGVTFTSTWNTDFTALTLTPSGFEHSQTVQLALTGQDRFGNTLGPGIVANPWSFTVTTDTIAPGGTLEVAGNDPASVLTLAAINLLFTKPVRPTSVSYSITPFVKGQLLWESDRRRAAFVHERFQVGQTYTFTLAAAKDNVGNLLVAPVQASFTVGPTLYQYFPRIGNSN